MEIAVWDTYVTKKDGNVMHFDILVPTTLKDTATIYNYGKDYICRKGQEGQVLSSNECTFCHIEEATEEMKTAINTNGYYIIEMQGCD